MIYAFWKRIRFFLAIVFRPLPHSGTGGIFWPWDAWKTSRAIEEFWT